MVAHRAKLTLFLQLLGRSQHTLPDHVHHHHHHHHDNLQGAPYSGSVVPYNTMSINYTEKTNHNMLKTNKDFD